MTTVTTTASKIAISANLISSPSPRPAAEIAKSYAVDILMISRLR